MAETQPEPPASALYGVRYSYHWMRTWRYVVTQPSVKNVGLAAATFSNKRGFEVRPGVSRLMAITGHSRPSVIDALATLRYLGFLFRRFYGQGSESKKADEYQLCLPRTVDHLPMIEPKSGRMPALHELSPMAQQTAIRLGVAAKLSKGTGQMSEPGGQVRQPLLVGSVNHWWLSQLTTPTHSTYSSTYAGHHHSDRHDRPDAGASGRRYDFDKEDDRYEYVCDHVGDLDPFESSMVDGMLSRGVHPKGVVNAILAGRQDPAA